MLRIPAGGMGGISGEKNYVPGTWAVVFIERVTEVMGWLSNITRSGIRRCPAQPYTGKQGRAPSGDALAELIPNTHCIPVVNSGPNWWRDPARLPIHSLVVLPGKEPLFSFVDNPSRPPNPLVRSTNDVLRTSCWFFLGRESSIRVWAYLRGSRQ